MKHHKIVLLLSTAIFLAALTNIAEAQLFRRVFRTEPAPIQMVRLPRATTEEYSEAAMVVFGDPLERPSKWQALKRQHIFAPAFVRAVERTIRNPNIKELRRFADFQERYTGDAILVD